MSEAPNQQNFSEWQAEVTARLAVIEDMLKRLLDQAMLAEQPTGRGLGH
jgi:hypothetical protein